MAKDIRVSEPSLEMRKKSSGRAVRLLSEKRTVNALTANIIQSLFLMTHEVMSRRNANRCGHETVFDVLSMRRF